MTDFDARMHALRARFIERARAEAALIEEHAARGEWKAVRDLAHGLAGRAGIFGFGALSDTARLLENAIDQPTSGNLAEISAALLCHLRRL